MSAVGAGVFLAIVVELAALTFTGAGFSIVKGPNPEGGAFALVAGVLFHVGAVAIYAAAIL